MDKLKYKKLGVIKGLCNNCQGWEMSFKGEIIMSCPPPPPFAKAELVQPLSWSLQNFYCHPPSPHTKYNVTVEDEKLENRLRYLSSDNPACAERFLREEYKKSHDDSNNRAVKREANGILDKLHTITEKVTKHDYSRFMEGGGGKLKTDLNCLHNFNVQWETTLYQVWRWKRCVTSYWGLAQIDG